MRLINLWPIVVLDDSLPTRIQGWNNALWIRMRPDAWPDWRGVYAQERYEWGATWRSFLLGRWVRRWNERIEEMGHAVEIAVRAAGGEDIDAAERDAATAMLDPTSSYARAGLWRGLGAADVVARLSANRAAAAAWVRDHDDHLTAVRDRAAAAIIKGD